MADQDASAPATKRLHILLIPGFAGFDALGQLEYYARNYTFVSEAVCQK